MRWKTAEDVIPSNGIKTILALGTHSMNGKAIIYPYWRIWREAMKTLLHSDSIYAAYVHYIR